MSGTTLQQSSSIKVGGFVVIEGRPCRVVEKSTSKTGKHGSAKDHFQGEDIFTGKKMVFMCSTTTKLDVPKITKIEYMVMDMDDDGFLSLLLNGRDKRDDLCAQGLADEIRAAINEGKGVYVTVMSALGEEIVTSMRAVME